MSAPKFTPGPWVAHPSTSYRGDIGMAWDVATHAATWDPNDFDEDEDSLGVWQEPDGYTRVARTSDMGPTAKANAYLIAAAPEMYEALERLLRTSLIDGGTRCAECEQHVENTSLRTCEWCSARAALAKAVPQ